MNWFDGAYNIQDACKILSEHFLRLMVGHGLKHVVCLFFGFVTCLSPMRKVSNSRSNLRNILEALGIQHMQYSTVISSIIKIHKYLVLKTSGCWMDGKLIKCFVFITCAQHSCLLFPQSYLQLNVQALQNDIYILQWYFWHHLLLLLKTFYECMHSLCLTDVKMPYMDKVHFHLAKFSMMMKDINMNMLN